MRNSAQCLIHEVQSVPNSPREDDVRDDCHQGPGRTQTLTQKAPETSMKGLLSG